MADKNNNQTQELDEVQVEEVAKTITRNAIFDLVEKKEASQKKSVTEIVKELLATGNAVRYNNLSIERITIGDVIPSSIPNAVPNTRIYLKLGDNVLGEVNELNELGNSEQTIKSTDFISTSTFGINLAVGEDKFLRIFSSEITSNPKKVSDLFLGGKCDVISQFVPAGEPFINPFNNGNSESKTYIYDKDRVFHHIVRIELGEFGKEVYASRKIN
jgi:hypothetical protein